MMKLYSTDGSTLMEIESLERDGAALKIKGKVLGTMPMTARLTATEARKGLKLLGFRTKLFLLTLPFRRS